MNHQEKQTSNVDLNEIQKKTLEVLNGPKYHDWPLGKCYLGAIRVVNNQNNPDRFAQAAHSYRELFEKLSWSYENKKPSIDFRQNAKYCLNRLNKDKERYSNGWRKQAIDTKLVKTIESISHFFNEYDRPSRMERIVLIYKMNFWWYKKSSPEEFKKIWNKLQRIAHHSSDEQSKCEQLLLDCDIFLYRLLCS
ncbi:MAG: hypothetical protein OXC02_12215 [Rhodobacteraceae bacterium]|nr:hypothetical protein [Paracoccaceae bacterium]